MFHPFFFCYKTDYQMNKMNKKNEWEIKKSARQVVSVNIYFKIYNA